MPVMAVWAVAATGAMSPVIAGARQAVRGADAIGVAVGAGIPAGAASGANTGAASPPGPPSTGNATGYGALGELSGVAGEAEVPV
jgi:hypothetical protein